MIALFKKIKAKLVTPLYETDFRKWASKCTVDELTEYVKTIGEDGHEFDFTFQCWGHAFNVTDRYGEFIQFGTGFHEAIFGGHSITKGSFLLLKTAKGVSRYLVLNIRWERDPRDMFWAYVVGLSK